MSAAVVRRQAGRPTLPLEQHYENEKGAQAGREGGRGGGVHLAEKGFTADKRKRIMICKEEKDRESWDGERARQR